VGFKQVVQAQREEFTAEVRVVEGEDRQEGVHDRLFRVLAQTPVDRPLEVTLNEVDQSSGNLTIQADHFRPVRGGRLDIGYRFNRRNQDNLNLLQRFEAEGDPAPAEELRGGYDYEERFHALYGTWALTRGAFGAQVGARAELSATDFRSPITGDDFSRSYNTLYPSLNLSWTRRPGQSLRVLYSKRISRPPPFYLDPFIPPTDPLNRSFGNPDLRPSYTDSYSLDATWSGSVGTVRLAPFYRHTTDVWERIRTVDTLGVATSRWQNAASSTSVGSTLTLSLRSGGRFSGSTNLSVYRDSRDGTNLSSDYRRSATLWSLGGNVGVRVSETLTAQAFGNHFPTQSILQGRASGYTYMSVAFRQQLMDSKGTLSLSVIDPFNLSRYSSSSSDATYRQEGRSTLSNRVVMLGFSYTFGRPPQRQSRPVGGPEEGAGETIRVP
jgi:outer membrane receptor protein involved in Fe transport